MVGKSIYLGYFYGMVLELGVCRFVVCNIEEVY